MNYSYSKNRISRLVLLVFLVMASFTPAQAQFKVIGYIWSRANMAQDLKKVDLEKITHLNIAFINPSPEGVFKDVPGLDTVVQIARQHNIKVFLSCGGGSSHAYYARLLEDAHRKTLVNNFIAVVDKYDLDGIDVDLEGDDIDANYEAFVVGLKKQLKKRKKLLSAAVAWWTRERITNVALAQFDFINIMAYDKTGPWKPEMPGQHAPISYAMDHLDYWRQERGMDKNKLNLGLPFYGYGFGELPTKDRSFRQLSWLDVQAKYPERMEYDEIVLPANGGTIYYNGKKTIKDKTLLATKDAGGVMIWQLLYDSPNEHSLLSLIDQTHKQAMK
ncbi:hypothetical protein C7T94_08430 [Pedobacter yulinensis]|uniref:chitinase n=1 Tax=Pedobacter yulinensis TaxID=2126353 RepID=A0A2T3HJQ5_9SPHI|nr:glycosyl hydrolase family 18 protein [Pedobacter yulinensis]PST82678.1 hypothetical protein C7T94_08430 [Pedobacter yulinensis]